jgi:hypothetical protein
MNKTENRTSTDQSMKRPIPERFYTSKSSYVFLFAFIDILIITIYVWFISFGSWTTWPTLTNYYDQLASAFDHGGLSLELKPDAVLLALANPYDPAARTGLSFPNDASLYKGKYYLYFGPVPALFLALVKSFGIGEMGDQYLVFAFISGILMLQTLLIAKIWRRFFQEVPVWVVAISIFFSCLITPFASMLTKARVYETAIASGQFFFLLGLYFIIIALDKEYLSKKYLWVGGISLSLAIGSRLTQILPIGFLLTMTAFWIVRTYFQPKLRSKAIFPLISLGFPLILGLTILAWYNWARFGSIFETGLSYQLAWTDPQKNYKEFFSLPYFFQNLYNYLFIPPKLRSVFPFIITVYGKIHPLLSSLSLPDIYYSEKITGLLYSVPFTLYALTPVVCLFHKSKQSPQNSTQDQHSYFFNWLVISLLGCFLFGFASFLAFFWAAIRYFGDFLPSLVILSIIGFWQGYRYYAAHPTSRMVYLAVGIGFMTVSIVASILLAISFSLPRFEEFNPHLWKLFQQ